MVRLKHLFLVLLMIFLLGLNRVSGQELPTCQIRASSITTFDWHPNGETLVFGSNCGMIMFNAEMTELLSFFPLERVSNISSIAFNTDGTLLAISRMYVPGSGFTGETSVWDIARQAEIRAFQDSYSTSPIVWHPTENVFVVGNWGEPRVANVDTGEISQRFALPGWENSFLQPLWLVPLACWSPNGSYVRLFVSQHTFVLTYPAWELVSVEDVPSAFLYGADCTHDPNHVALPSGHFEDLVRNRQIRTDNFCNGISADWNPQGEQEFAVNCDDSRISIFNWEGEILQSLEGDIQPDTQFDALRTTLRTIAYSRDGSRLLALGDNGYARLWDTETYTLLTRVNIADLANAALANSLLDEQ
jgi:WD40 repeat protein